MKHRTRQLDQTTTLAQGALYGEDTESGIPSSPVVKSYHLVCTTRYYLQEDEIAMGNRSFSIMQNIQGYKIIK